MKSQKKIFKKALKKADPTARELAEIVSDLMIEYYGTHNFKTFKDIVSKKLKSGVC